jgi:hypothetical protein
MPFSKDSEVDVKAVDDKNWKLHSELKYVGKWDSFVVPIEADTDFASVPRVFVWFLPSYGRYTKAAILHDWLWRHAVPAGNLTLPEADAIFRRAMRELDVPFLRRWFMWSAVRLGALKKPGGRERWLRHSWQVLPAALLALPIVAIPATAILAALFLFYIVEMVFYLPLKLAAMIRTRRGDSVKKVNGPELSLTLK